MLPRKTHLPLPVALLCVTQLGGVGCSRRLPRPLSVVSLAEHNSARALVRYLALPGASAAVCGRSPAGFHVTLTALDGQGAARLAAADTAVFIKVGRHLGKIRTQLQAAQSIDPATVGQLLDTIHDVRRLLNPRLRILGVLPTLFDSRTNHAKAVLADIEQRYELPILTPPIPKSVRFAEAPCARCALR